MARRRVESGNAGTGDFRASPCGAATTWRHAVEAGYDRIYHRHATRKEAETCDPQCAEFLRLKRNHASGSAFSKRRVKALPKTMFADSLGLIAVHGIFIGRSVISRLAILLAPVPRTRFGKRFFSSHDFAVARHNRKSLLMFRFDKSGRSPSANPARSLGIEKADEEYHLTIYTSVSSLLCRSFPPVGKRLQISVERIKKFSS
jgi:hypothetical protein